MNSAESSNAPSDDQVSAGSPTPPAIANQISDDRLIRKTVLVSITADRLHVYNSMLRVFGLSDDEFTSQAVSFAMFCHQIGLVKGKPDMTDSLVHQLASFDVLRGRMQQAMTAIQQSESLLVAVLAQATNAIAAHDGRSDSTRS